MSNLRQTAFRVVALIGLGVSALLLAEYIASAPSLCTGDGGCNTVRESSFASILGIPTPVWGVSYFAAMLGISLLSDTRARTWLVYLTGAGALAAIGFLVIQAAVIGAFCTYCVIVDFSALALFALAWVVRKAEDAAAPSRATIASYGGITAAVCAIGLLTPSFAADDFDTVGITDVPDFILAAQKPGKVTIVEFMDFRCGTCKAMHEVFSKVLPEYGDKVELVYRHKPVVGPDDAARAWVCADKVGKGNEMAHELFSARGINPATADGIAQSLGIELGSFRDCVASKETAEHIARDLADADSAGITGVPVYWIGTARKGSITPAPALRAVIDEQMAKVEK